MVCTYREVKVGFRMYVSCQRWGSYKGGFLVYLRWAWAIPIGMIWFRSLLLEEHWTLKKWSSVHKLRGVLFLRVLSLAVKSSWWSTCTGVKTLIKIQKPPRKPTVPGGWVSTRLVIGQVNSLQCFSTLLFTYVQRVQRYQSFRWSTGEVEHWT